MSHKTFSIFMILVLIFALPATLGLAQSPHQTNDAPKPLGQIVGQQAHLVQPREEVVINVLMENGVIPLNALPDVRKAAVDKYYQEFAKLSSDWITPEIQMAVQKHEKELVNQTRTPQADPTAEKVSVSIFALAVDFGGSDTFANTNCKVASATYTGPMQGEIPAPTAPDNFTLWYDPAVTADVNFYNDLIFGYTGVGRVRMDLLDPHDGQPGINLAGYTVQDYYDHFAGVGNVALEGLVSGWITVNHSEAYYGAQACSSSGTVLDNDGGQAPVGQLVADAVAEFMAAHPGYSTDTSSNAFWKQFDKNADGIVDTTWIIHAGEGEESGGGLEGSDAIWSHSWDLVSQGVDPIKVYEGNPATQADDIFINPYTMQPENTDLGVMVEEFGHNFFGLPDLYTTDAQNSVGFWSEMSAGSYGGELAGSSPVGMPLWFRMIATCGKDTNGNAQFCNWQYPMAIRDYKDSLADIPIGALDGFDGTGGNLKGIQINLPSVVGDPIVNETGGTGKAAWSGTGLNDLTSYIQQDIAVPAGTSSLSFKTYWFIEDCRPGAICDYAAVQLKDGASDWVYLTDGVSFDDSFGEPVLLGEGGPKTITIPLSAYAGKTVTLRFVYHTDPGYTDPGWWIDDVKINSTLLTNGDFEANLTGWTTAPADAWKIVPMTMTFARYYLVEWRSTTKYDQFLSAYVTTDSTATAWRVERVPYNIPGAVIYYRDTRYGEGYSQRQYYEDPPSFGPKNKLLVVDMNYQPMRIFNPGVTPSAGYLASLNTRSSSYDAALTLQPSQPITFSKIYGVVGGPFVTIPAKPSVSTFNDAHGYYAGFYFGAPCGAGSICYANRDGSVVIPARGDYSSRITDFGGNPLYELYEEPVAPWWFGSGNPGDEMKQLGVNVDLISKSADGMTGVIRVRNYSVDITTTPRVIFPIMFKPHVKYTSVVHNNGTQPVNNVRITYFLDPNLNYISAECPAAVSDLPMQANGMVKVCNLPSLAPGETKTVTLTSEVANSALRTTTRVEVNDGQILRGPWWYTARNDGYYFQILPLISR